MQGDYAVAFEPQGERTKLVWIVAGERSGAGVIGRLFAMSYNLISTKRSQGWSPESRPKADMVKLPFKQIRAFFECRRAEWYLVLLTFIGL